MEFDTEDQVLLILTLIDKIDVRTQHKHSATSTILGSIEVQLLTNDFESQSDSLYTLLCVCVFVRIFYTHSTYIMMTIDLWTKKC